ncbi:molecular chaperone [Pseudomonas sp. 30_B]|uniref:fimbrial biogenesis chaperone n=1 Tax=Pseudomonas sp. 30_B TaxID=2813575 RepID=UPI001A9EF237|nr:molecular chaperone [Pseudomonas sp. 30_B]
MRRRLLCGLFYGLVLFASALVQAGVTTERTRVIFPAGSNEVSLRVANINPYPVMVQTWIDDGALNSTPDKSISAFMPLPPVFSLLPSEHRTLRLLYTGERIPSNRESVFWLNVYEIPPTGMDARQTPEQQRLIVAMRTQIKLFYRPSELPMKAVQAAGKLTFSLRAADQAMVLRIENPTPYYVTLSGLAIRQGMKQQSIMGDMIAPLSSLELPVADLVVGQRGEVLFNWIDDDGNAQDASAVLQ